MLLFLYREVFFSVIFVVCEVEIFFIFLLDFDDEVVCIFLWIFFILKLFCCSLFIICCKYKGLEFFEGRLYVFCCSVKLFIDRILFLVNIILDLNFIVNNFSKNRF